MSITIDTLLKSQGEVHLMDIEIKWYFTPQSDEENTVEIQGTYNIDSYYDSRTTEIQHPRTQVTGFYEIFNKLQFTDIATQSTFILGISHVTEYGIADEILSVEFVFHRSIPQIAFNIEQPIIAGIAEINSPSENLLMLESLIQKNLHLHFSDHVFQIPRCNRCSSALTIKSPVDLEDEVINEDFVCSDCYMVINNFYNLLEKEVYKITEHEQMKEQRDNLIKFLMTGKKNASQIEETQLQHFYNLLIIYVEFLSGNLDQVNVLQKIQTVQKIGVSQNFPLLQQEAENLLDKIDFEPQEEPSQEETEETVAPEPETWTPKETHANTPEAEPTPPPLPMGTPSPATVLPQEEEISEGLQSLEEVQAELESTLQALSQIESDLSPRPISPTDNMHAVNAELEEEKSDKIPTYEDIKETFSDLESLNFPDIQFGTDTSVNEGASEEYQILNQVEQNSEADSAGLNPPPVTTHDYQEERSTDSHSNMPTIQELPPQESEIQELGPADELNPPPGMYQVSEQEFSGSGQVKTMRDLKFGEESEYESEIQEGAEGKALLSPPIISQTDQLNPEWRDISETTPPPQMNPPPQVNPPLKPVTPPPQVNPPLELVTPPPQMNPPPQVNPPLEPIAPPQADQPPDLEEIIQAEKPPEIPKEEPKQKIPSKSSFFNNGYNGKVASQQPKQKVSRPKPGAKPKPSPKEIRAIRKRKNKIRRIICSFCGQTMNDGKKVCPNCGSPVR